MIYVTLLPLEMATMTDCSLKSVKECGGLAIAVDNGAGF